MKIPRWVRKKATLYISTSIVLPLLVGFMHARGFDPDAISQIVDALVAIAMVYFPSQGVADFAEYWRNNRNDIINAREAPPE